MQSVDFALKVAKLFGKNGDISFDDLYKLVEEKLTARNKQSESLICPNCKSTDVEDLVEITDMACKNCSFKWKA